MGFMIHKTKTKVPVENIATGRNRTVRTTNLLRYLNGLDVNNKSDRNPER